MFTWWKEQMRDLVPASLRPLERGWRRVLVVMAEAINTTEVELCLQGRSGHTSLGRHAVGVSLRHALSRLPKAMRRAAVLQVPAGLLLDRQVVLPLSAEQGLSRVVEHEIDRLTPFRADEVLWDCTTERRDTEHGRIHVRVTIVPLRQVQPMLDALRQVGLVPSRIQAACSGQMRTIHIADDGPRRAWSGPRTQAWLGGGCGVLASTAVALPFIVQAVAQDNIEAQITAMRPQVIEAENLRKVIASGATTADVIAAARAQIGSPLQSVALLTEMLSDDTYLTLLSISQRKVSISGRSAAAARLIGALAAHPLLHNPAFAAPVVRDETNGGEMFSIRVEVVL